MKLSTDVLSRLYALGVQEVPQLTSIDSSKLSTYAKCPRMFFFSHVAGFTPEDESIHLVAGRALHSAMEHIQKYGYTNKAWGETLSIMKDTMRPHYPEITWSSLKGKDPLSMHVALSDYIMRYGKEDAQDDLISTEQAYVIPISEDTYIIVKLDSLRRKVDKLIWVVDTKTSGARYNYTIEQFIQRFQFKAYTFALHSMYPSEQVGGVIVDLMILRSKDHELERIPIVSTYEALEDWFFSATSLTSRLKGDFEACSDVKVGDPIMRAFPKVTENCVQFNRMCPFHSLCYTNQNPSRLLQFQVEGYKREIWNPLATEDPDKDKNFPLEPTTLNIFKDKAFE